jgi:hypothetical protein
MIERELLKMLKFMWNGIKVCGESQKDDKLFKAWYSKGSYAKESKIPVGTITIYAREYESFPQIKGLNIENNSDSMTDYFEKDRIRVAPGSRYYTEVNEAWGKQEEHNKKRFEKKYSA